MFVRGIISCLLEGSYVVFWRDHILFVGGIISCLLDGSYLVSVICVYLCVVVSNTYCVCYCFVILRIVYLMLPASLDYPYLIAPSVFYNVYYIYLKLNSFNHSFDIVGFNSVYCANKCLIYL